MGVVEPADDGLIDGAFEVPEGEGGIGRDFDAGLDAVVVAVTVFGVALSEEGAVLVGGEGGDVEAMRGGELELLPDEDASGSVRGHFDGMVGGQSPAQPADLAGEGMAEEGDDLSQDGRRVGVRAFAAGACDGGDGEGSHGLVDVLDVDEKAGVGVGRTDAGDVEFVVTTEPTEGGDAAFAVDSGAVIVG